MATDSYRKGTELRAALMGPVSLASMDKTASSGLGMQSFSDLTRSTIFGTLWQRDGIDLKLRTLICVVTDIAMGVDDELAIHLEMALRQGWTEVELVETILHAGSYVGIPRARQGVLIADQTFARLRENHGGSTSSKSR
jgi:4-carboxymuconolactone decarboxylase